MPVVPKVMPPIYFNRYRKVNDIVGLSKFSVCITKRQRVLEDNYVKRWLKTLNKIYQNFYYPAKY